jgi:hypothetical protein
VSRQQSNREIYAEAARFNATKHDLERGLRRAGVRNVHTSPKARKLIERAKSIPLIDKRAIAEEMKRRHAQ